MKQTIISVALALSVISGFAQSKIELSSSDARLTESFVWAKKTALSYTRTGDKVGLWYEAALPDRESFCMRDVSHMSFGAYYLGLKDYNKNMFAKFAQYIAPSRDWCSYWEITKDDKPTPCDYSSDTDFFISLNANFDVMNSCFWMYRLTGDKDYVEKEPFTSFYNHSLNEHVKAWDSNGDGILDNDFSKRNVLATYMENNPEIFSGVDVLMFQWKACLLYANMLKGQGKSGEAAKYLQFAGELQKKFEQNWWDTSDNSPLAYMLKNGTLKKSTQDDAAWASLMGLYLDVIKDKAKVQRMLEILRNWETIVECDSYTPLVFFRYDEPEIGYRRMLAAVDPKVERRNYPEVSYSFVGSVAEGLMGLELNAPANRLQTTPKLPKELGWVELRNIPWKQGSVTVKHNGTQSTTMTSAAKQSFIWRAMLSGNTKTLYVNGKKVKAKSTANFNGEPMTYVEVLVKPDTAITVSKYK